MPRHMVAALGGVSDIAKFDDSIVQEFPVALLRTTIGWFALAARYARKNFEREPLHQAVIALAVRVFAGMVPAEISRTGENPLGV